MIIDSASKELGDKDLEAPFMKEDLDEGEIEDGGLDWRDIVHFENRCSVRLSW